MPDDERKIPYLYLVLIGLIAGLIIGLLMGLAEAVSGLTPKDARKAIAMGALVGAGGGMVGLTFGQAVYSIFNGTGASGWVSCILAGPHGSRLRLGSDRRIHRRCRRESPPARRRRMWNGALGGFIGGAHWRVGCSRSSRGSTGFPGINIPPAMVRFIGFSITGGAIGLLIGCVEELAKQAWLVRLVGNNEGRAIDLYGTRVVIGRSEFADIPIFSDPDVSEKHAAIFTQGKAYYIEDLGSTFGTSVNGDKITKEYLSDGDRISVGKTKFVFHDKATARMVSGAGRQSAAVQIPTSQHVCPFCGSIKDAAGNCDCTVGAVSHPPPRPVAGDPIRRAAESAWRSVPSRRGRLAGKCPACWQCPGLTRGRRSRSRPAKP